MKDNPLLADLNHLGENIGTTFGILYQLECHLTDYKKILKERFEPIKHKIKQPIIATTLVIGDLTGNSDKGWKINFPTDFYFELRLEDIDYKIDLLIERESMRNIAFCYEVLEKFMYDITAKYLFTNRERYKDQIKRSFKTSEDTLDGYQQAIRNLKGKNNKEILSLLRKLSDHFSKAESKNNEGIDLKDWFEVFSRVRHGIVHSSFKLKKDIKQPLTIGQRKILNKYFPNEEQDKFYDLKIKKQHADKMLNLITEYGILIFKSLSIEGNYHWKVFKNMDGLRGHSIQQSL